MSLTPCSPLACAPAAAVASPVAAGVDFAGSFLSPPPHPATTQASRTASTAESFMNARVRLGRLGGLGLPGRRVPEARGLDDLQRQQRALQARRGDVDAQQVEHE